MRDLHNALDIAAQAFESFWVSDHLMTEDPFRMDVWTQLTWIAARYPGQLLGTIVLANSFRHPPLMAKMAASLQAFSRGRLILGYGAGWLEGEYRAYGYEFHRRAYASSRWSKPSSSCAACGPRHLRPSSGPTIT